MLTEFIFKDPPFKSCHAPSIAQTNDGLIAVWFGGNSEGHKKTGIWLSKKKNQQWSDPIEVVNGKQPSGRSFPCWNPVVFHKSDGELLLFYKIGNTPSDWKGLFISSYDEGDSWSKPISLPKGLFGPTKNKPIQLNDGNLLCPSSDEKFGLWKLQFELFSNSQWKLAKISEQQDYDCIQPTLLRHSESILQALCRSDNGRIIETWSYDEGKSWGALSDTVLSNPNSAIDAVSLNENKHLLVYNDSKEGRSNLVVALSQDGKAWKNFLTLEGGDGEYSYPSIIKGSDSSVHIVYTWNRKNIKYVLLNENDIP